MLQTARTRRRRRRSCGRRPTRRPRPPRRWRGRPSRPGPTRSLSSPGPELDPRCPAGLQERQVPGSQRRLPGGHQRLRRGDRRAGEAQVAAGSNQPGEGEAKKDEGKKDEVPRPTAAPPSRLPRGRGPRRNQRAGGKAARRPPRPGRSSRPSIPADDDGFLAANVSKFVAGSQAQFSYDPGPTSSPWSTPSATACAAMSSSPGRWTPSSSCGGRTSADHDGVQGVQGPEGHRRRRLGQRHELRGEHETGSSSSRSPSRRS